MGDSPEAIPTRLARGEAEIGFQQVSELIHVPGITFVGTIPVEVQPITFFAGALTTAVRQPEAARAPIRFLASPEAAPVISKAGLMPLAARQLGSRRSRNLCVAIEDAPRQRRVKVHR